MKILMACNEVCEMGKRSKDDTWWWNEDEKETVSRKKMHTRRCVEIVLRRIITRIKE